MKAGGGAWRLVGLISLIALGGGLMTVEPGRTMAVGDASPQGVRFHGVPVAAPVPAPALALAVQAEASLGLPAPAGRSVARVADAVSGQQYDEVTDLDSQGVPVAVSRFDPSGSLVSAVRLGYVGPATATIPAASAGQAASAILAKVGIAAPGMPAVSARAAGGWLVRWVRQAGGVPVPGDGVGVQLNADGTFHAVIRTEHPLAPAPTATIDAVDARLLAGVRLDGWLPAGLRADATIDSVALAWVAPNDTFGDPLPSGSAGPLRLAWIVRVATSGALADTVTGLELAFDAGDGTPLGGDVLE